MAKFQPIKCTKAQMDAKAKAEGQIFFCTDTHDIYIDTNSTTRIEIAGEANNVISLGNKTVTASGTTANNISDEIDKNGISMNQSYNDANTPIQYGNIINVKGAGAGQLLLGWSGTDSQTAAVFYRSHRDTTTGGWGPWKQLAFTDSSITGNAATATKATQDSAGQQINTTYIKGLSASGNKLTYTKGNGTTGNLTLPSGITEEEVNTKINALKYGTSTSNGYSVTSNSGNATISIENNKIKLVTSVSNGKSFNVILIADHNIATGALKISNSRNSLNGPLSGFSLYIGDEYIDSYETGYSGHTIINSTEIPTGTQIKFSFNYAGSSEYCDLYIEGLYTGGSAATQYLPINNTQSYTPTEDYHPATKQYVDGMISPQVCTPATLTNISTDYKFVLNEKGYFVNNNAKKSANNSYVLGRVKFYAKNPGTILLSYRCYAESTYDYGIFGQLDQALSESNTDDGSSESTKVLLSCKGAQSTEYKTISYNITTSGEHFFDVKYRKDSSTDSGDDTFQFQLMSSNVIGSIISEEDLSYIKKLSLSGTTITCTKGDGTTENITLPSGGSDVDKNWTRIALKTDCLKNLFESTDYTEYRSMYISVDSSKAYHEVYINIELKELQGDSEIIPEYTFQYKIDKSLPLPANAGLTIPLYKTTKTKSELIGILKIYAVFQTSTANLVNIRGELIAYNYSFPTDVINTIRVYAR